MAVTKIWTIKDSLQRVLDYAANPDKTEYDALAQTLHYAENDAKTKLNESAQLVTGIHCRADHAWEDMRAVQKRFGKTDGVVALHAYQSFREGEVTPEQCHEIGVALARKVWGKRFQVLVATHMNTDNLHNHFVINSVSYVDGKKYEQRRSQYAEFRAASDKLCREYGAKFILDDHVELVRELNADGVHLGKLDMPVAEARRLLGPEYLIGATANTFEDIERGAGQGADYIGLGPFRFTQTKRNLSPVLGLEGYRTIMERCRNAGIALPVVAIGGITAADVENILATGVTGIALSGALLQAENTLEETQRIINIINRTKQ